nr:hypothetical protein [uncultured Carboxylicivirga sp.]
MKLYSILQNNPRILKGQFKYLLNQTINKNTLQTIILFVCIYTFTYTSIQAQSKVMGKTVYAPFDSIAHVMENLNERDPELPVLLKRLYTIADDTSIPILKYRCYYWDALIQRKIANRIDSTCMQNLKNAIIYMDSSEYFFDYARIRFLMLNPTFSISNYVDQYETYLEFLDLFKQSGDIKYQANVNRWLGILMSELDEPEIALNYLKSANELYNQIEAHNLAYTNEVNMSVVYNKLGQTDKTIEILQRLINKEQFRKDTIALVALYTNLATLIDDSLKRDEYYVTAYDLSKKHGKNIYQYHLTRTNLGNYYLRHNQPDSALQCFQDSYLFSKKYNISRLLSPSLIGLATAYKSKGEWEKAFDYQNTYIQATDSIKGIDKVSEINKMESGIAIKEYQNKLIIEQQTNELNHKQNVITVILLLSLIIIAFFITLSVWQKNRITASQLKNEELQNDNLQQEIDLRNRELSATSLVLSEKNGILGNILTQMEKFRKNGEMSNPCENTLRKMINNNLQTENEWESFKIHFEKVHPDFFTKLKEKHVELSENELKLCAYIRIGMTSKQISQMISVLPNTIKTNRYLMRKKMHLETKESLDDYIRSI